MIIRDSIRAFRGCFVARGYSRRVIGALHRASSSGGIGKAREARCAEVVQPAQNALRSWHRGCAGVKVVVFKAAKTTTLVLQSSRCAPGHTLYRDTKTPKPGIGGDIRDPICICVCVLRQCMSQLQSGYATKGGELTQLYRKCRGK